MRPSVPGTLPAIVVTTFPVEVLENVRVAPKTVKSLPTESVSVPLLVKLAVPSVVKSTPAESLNEPVLEFSAPIWNQDPPGLRSTVALLVVMLPPLVESTPPSTRQVPPVS